MTDISKAAVERRHALLTRSFGHPHGIEQLAIAATLRALSARNEALEAQLATARDALREIATGRDADGRKTDFPADIAARALTTGDTTNADI